MKYWCWLQESPKSDGKEIELADFAGFGFVDAAEEFAEYVFHRKGMWKHKSGWKVCVKDESNELKIFVIDVEQEPVFTARLCAQGDLSI